MRGGISEQEMLKRLGKSPEHEGPMFGKEISLWGKDKEDAIFCPLPQPHPPPQPGDSFVPTHINYTYGTHSVIFMQHRRWPKHFGILSIICSSSSSRSAYEIPSSLMLPQNVLKNDSINFLCFELLNHSFRRMEFSCCNLNKTYTSILTKY